MPIRPPDIGSFLRAARGKRAQRELAHALGVSVQAVSQWETNERRPPSKKLAAIAQTYGVEETALQQFFQGAVAKPEAEDGRGLKLIERVLKDVADSARIEGEPRTIIHSFSTRGFLTGEHSDLAIAVLDCAVAGVDVVFICFPPGSPGEDPTVEKVQEELRQRFQSAQRRKTRHCEDADMAKAAAHLWCVTPNEKRQLDAAGAILSSAVRVMAVVRETRVTR